MKYGVCVCVFSPVPGSSNDPFCSKEESIPQNGPKVHRVLVGIDNVTFCCYSILLSTNLLYVLGTCHVTISICLT